MANTPKQDYNYKRPIHRQWHKFIKHTLRKAPQRTKVLFLPGSSAAEYHNVYKRHSIPPRNIIGVERNAKIAKGLRARAEFPLWEGDLLDFVNSTDQVFDVVSLDFTGHLTEREKEIISTIGKRGLLRNRSALLTNFCGQREGEHQREEHKDFLMKHRGSEIVRRHIRTGPAEFRLEKVGSVGEYENLARRIEDDPESVLSLPEDQAGYLLSGENLELLPEKMDLEKMRDLVMPLEVFEVLNRERAKINCMNSEIFRDFLEICPERFRDTHFFYRNAPDEPDSIRIIPFKEGQETSEEEKKDFLYREGLDLYFQGTFEHVSYQLFSWVTQTTDLVRRYELNSYMPKQIRLTRYISDDGTPMDCDFFAMETERGQLREVKGYRERFFEEGSWWIGKEMAEKIERKDILGAMMSLHEKVKDRDSYKKAVGSVILDHIRRSAKIQNNLCQTYVQLAEGEIKREFLGNFYKPRYKKEEVAQMLLEGKSDQEVHEIFRIRKMELAGIKAAITKGQYEHLKGVGEGEGGGEPEEEEESDTGPPKEKIYQAILEGGTTQDIARTFVISPGQVKGYRAFLTRQRESDQARDAREKIRGREKKGVVESIIASGKEEGVLYLGSDIESINTHRRLLEQGFQVTHADTANDFLSHRENGTHGIYIIEGAEKEFKLVEDLGLSYEGPYRIPAILLGGSNSLKEMLRELTMTEESLGLISRKFFCPKMRNHLNARKPLQEMLNESMLYV